MQLASRVDERREQAQDWVARRLAKAKDTADAGDCYKTLAGIAEDPRFQACGETLQAQTRSLLEQASSSAEVQPVVQARRIYERGLWEEQTAASLSDLEDALALYKQAAKRYPKTSYGRLAGREADRVQILVDDGHAEARARAPKVPRRKIIITK
jgi:hypothetical protein